MLVWLEFYVNSHTVSLPVLNTVLRLPGAQVLKFMILSKSSQCLLTLLMHSVAFSNGLLFSNCFYVHTLPSRQCVIIVPKWNVPNGNHLNDDVAEVNGLAATIVTRLFPPQKRAWVWGQQLHRRYLPLLHKSTQVQVSLHIMSFTRLSPN